MSRQDSWIEVLLEASARRNISFSENELHAIRSAEVQSPLAIWVREHLVASEPLSVDEYSLWQLLDESTTIDASDRTSAGFSLPSTEEDFQSAISALKASTKSIGRRTDVLNAQNAHLVRISTVEAAVQSQKSRHVQYFSQKEAAEIQHVKFANEQTSLQLQLDLQAEADSVAKEIKAVPAVVTELLNSDDRALTTLNDVSSAKSLKASLDVDHLKNRADDLLTALRHLRANLIKDSLDCTYLEALEHSTDDSTIDETSDDTAEAIQRDLGSLYTEIDDMVTMVVSHEHGNSIYSALQDVQQLQQEEDYTLSDQIYSKLCNLTNSLEKLSTRLEKLQLQRLALRDLSSQTRSLESRTLSRSTPPALLSQHDDEKVHSPAATALLQHLGVSRRLDAADRTTLNEQLNTLATKLQSQSSEEIGKILRISEEAAAKRRAALQRLSDALATNPAKVSELRELEERIAATRREMESSASSTGDG